MPGCTTAVGFGAAAYAWSSTISTVICGACSTGSSAPRHTLPTNCQVPTVGEICWRQCCMNRSPGWPWVLQTETAAMHMASLPPLGGPLVMQAGV